MQRHLNRHSAAAFVLLLGAVLGAGMGVYPPWAISYQERGKGQVQEDVGYEWIFTPPFDDAYVDVRRLGVQWMAVVLFVGGVAAALKIRPRDPKP